MKVRFDTGGVPSQLDSWRGSYDELTLIHGDSDAPETVDSLLADAKAALGATFTGYKGGEFGMNESTPIWADDYGRYCCNGVMGVRVEHDEPGRPGDLIVVTADLSDYR